MRFPPRIVPLILLCGFVGFLAHLPALWGGLVWDDIASGATIQGNDKGATTGAFHVENQEAPWIFRPATTLLLVGAAKVNDALRDLVPPDERASFLATRHATVFHLVSLLVHALTTMAVAALLQRCLAGHRGARTGTLLGGLIFAVHPIHTENVAWVASLADAFSTLLLLVALLLTAPAGSRRSLKALGLGGAMFLAALLSKETAVTGIALLPLLLWYEGVGEREGPSGFLLPMSSFLAALFVYLLLRFTHYGGLATGSGALVGANVGDGVRALSFYFHKLFLPWPARPYIAEIPDFSPEDVLAVAAAVASIALYRRGMKIFLFCLAWFLVALSPTLALLSKTLTVAPVAERYLYLPSVGFALAIGGLATLRPWLYLPIAALALVFAFTSFSNVSMWRSDLALWTYVISQGKATDSALPWLNLGYGYYAELDLDNAEKNVLSARERLKADERVLAAKIRFALGSIHAKRGELQAAGGDLPSALRHYQTGFGHYLAFIDSEPRSFDALMDAGTVRVRIVLIEKALTGRIDQTGLQQSLRLFEKALEVSPGNPVAGKRIEELRALGLR